MSTFVYLLYEHLAKKVKPIKCLLLTFNKYALTWNTTRNFIKIATYYTYYKHLEPSVSNTLVCLFCLMVLIV